MLKAKLEQNNRYHLATHAPRTRRFESQASSIKSRYSRTGQKVNRFTRANVKE